MAVTIIDVLPDDIGERVEKLLRRASDRKLMLVTAESCTGGLLASLFTDIEGCSHVFERGFVVYTDEAKRELLGVSQGSLHSFGAVSETVAREMAEGALQHSRGHIGIAVTGFAGPGAPGDEPGLVHLAVTLRDGPTSHREEHFGDAGRGAVRLACIRTALDMLEDALP
jgi:nicotinamide-nucleotide amidase